MTGEKDTNEKAVGLFSCIRPCSNCPYRKDAPLRYWHPEVFARLWVLENSKLGAVYRCHKDNGSICVGWLIKQDEAYLPSLNLRMELSAQNITRDYMDKLSSPVMLYKTTEEMIGVNYPELFSNLDEK